MEACYPSSDMKLAPLEEEGQFIKSRLVSRFQHERTRCLKKSSREMSAASE